jgi:hypothetical protein
MSGALASYSSPASILSFSERIMHSLLAGRPGASLPIEHTSSNRQPLKTLLTTTWRPLTRGRQQGAEWLKTLPLGHPGEPKEALSAGGLIAPS